MGSDLCLDLVLTRDADNAAIALKVAVIFDNGPDSFHKIRDIKTYKYQETARSLRSIYKDVSIEVVVVGALGSWDPLKYLSPSLL